MAYKQVKINTEYLEQIESLGFSANQAIGKLLEIHKVSPVRNDKNTSNLGLGNPKVTPLGNPNMDPELLNTLITTVSTMHKFLWKTQTCNGYKNPSSYMINQKATEIYNKMQVK